MSGTGYVALWTDAALAGGARVGLVPGVVSCVVRTPTTLDVSLTLTVTADGWQTVRTRLAAVRTGRPAGTELALRCVLEVVWPEMLTAAGALRPNVVGDEYRITRIASTVGAATVEVQAIPVWADLAEAEPVRLGSSTRIKDTRTGASWVTDVIAATPSAQRLGVQAGSMPDDVAFALDLEMATPWAVFRAMAEARKWEPRVTRRAMDGGYSLGCALGAIDATLPTRRVQVGRARGSRLVGGGISTDANTRTLVEAIVPAGQVGGDRGLDAESRASMSGARARVTAITLDTPGEPSGPGWLRLADPADPARGLITVDDLLVNAFLARANVAAAASWQRIVDSRASDSAVRIAVCTGYAVGDLVQFAADALGAPLRTLRHPLASTPPRTTPLSLPSVRGETNELANPTFERADPVAPLFAPADWSIANPLGLHQVATTLRKSDLGRTVQGTVRTARIANENVNLELFLTLPPQERVYGGDSILIVGQSFETTAPVLLPATGAATLPCAPLAQGIASGTPLLMRRKRRTTPYPPITLGTYLGGLYNGGVPTGVNNYLPGVPNENMVALGYAWFAVFSLSDAEWGHVLAHPYFGAGIESVPDGSVFAELAGDFVWSAGANSPGPSSSTAHVVPWKGAGFLYTAAGGFNYAGDPHGRVYLAGVNYNAIGSLPLYGRFLVVPVCHPFGENNTLNLYSMSVSPGATLSFTRRVVVVPVTVASTVAAGATAVPVNTGITGRVPASPAATTVVAFVPLPSTSALTVTGWMGAFANVGANGTLTVDTGSSFFTASGIAQAGCILRLEGQRRVFDGWQWITSSMIVSARIVSVSGASVTIEPLLDGPWMAENDQHIIDHGFPQQWRVTHVWTAPAWGFTDPNTLLAWHPQHFVRNWGAVAFDLVPAWGLDGEQPRLSGAATRNTGVQTFTGTAAWTTNPVPAGSAVVRSTLAAPYLEAEAAFAQPNLYRADNAPFQGGTADGWIATTIANANSPGTITIHVMERADADAGPVGPLSSWGAAVVAGTTVVEAAAGTVMARRSAQAAPNGDVDVLLVTSPTYGIGVGQPAIITRPLLTHPDDSQDGHMIRLLYAIGGSNQIVTGTPGVRSSDVPITALRGASGAVLPTTVTALVDFILSAQTMTLGQMPGVAICNAAGTVLAWGRLADTTVATATSPTFARIVVSAVLTGDADVHVRVAGGSNTEASRWQLVRRAMLCVHGSDETPFTAHSHVTPLLFGGAEVIGQLGTITPRVSASVEVLRDWTDAAPTDPPVALHQGVTLLDEAGAPLTPTPLRVVVTQRNLTAPDVVQVELGEVVTPLAHRVARLLASGTLGTPTY